MISVATSQARWWVSTAIHVAARTLAPIATWPTSGTENVSVKTVTPNTHTVITPATPSNQSTGRARTRPRADAADVNKYNAANITNTTLSTTFGPPSGSCVAGNQRQAKMATRSVVCVHAPSRGNSPGSGTHPRATLPVFAKTKARLDDDAWWRKLGATIAQE